MSLFMLDDEMKFVRLVILLILMSHLMQPITNGGVDPAVLAALPPSIQLDLLVQVIRSLVSWSIKVRFQFLTG